MLGACPWHLPHRLQVSCRRAITIDEWHSAEVVDVLHQHINQRLVCATCESQLWMRLWEDLQGKTAALLHGLVCGDQERVCASRAPTLRPLPPVASRTALPLMKVEKD